MVRDILEKEIRAAAKKLPAKHSVFGKMEFAVEHPKQKEHGDYTSNIALVLASELKQKPIDIANKIRANLLNSRVFNKYVEKTEIAGPGFLNFWLSDKALEYGLKQLSGQTRKTQTKTYLPASKDRKLKTNIEFISANPTGPLHIGHGRGAFYGDVLANVLKAAGYKVEREYFINDAKNSTQIKELGKTVLGKGKAYLTKELKDKSEKLKVKVKSLKLKQPENLESEVGYLMAQEIQSDNRAFIEKKLGIKFDRWVSEEKDLQKKNYFAKALKLLKAKKLVYKKEGAVWLKTSKYGDDEDRVIIRSAGEPTYFLADIAYHLHKFKRGYDIIIDIWGADPVSYTHLTLPTN